MIIAVASGKGGTGKTTVATSLALSIASDSAVAPGQPLFLDCDVEEPNAALFLRPTLSSIHGLERVLGTVTHFRVPAVVCINKADLNPARTAAIEAFSREKGIEVTGRLPFDTVVTEAMVQGQPVTIYEPNGAMTTALREVWVRIRLRLA